MLTAQNRQSGLIGIVFACFLFYMVSRISLKSSGDEDQGLLASSRASDDGAASPPRPPSSSFLPPHLRHVPCYLYPLP